MTYIKMFLAVTLLVAAYNTSSSAQTPVSPSGVQKTDEFSYLADPWNDQCVSGNCVNGKGKMVYSTGNTYEGDFVGGKKVGQGTYTFKNGQVYVGQFSDDLRNGKGKFTFSDGSIYEGRFVNDNFIGHGIYTPKSGTKQTANYTVGQIVDLQTKIVGTDFWGKAEIIEILGDKYKVRDLWLKTIEIVAEQQIRPFTAPVKYEIGQKVEILDKGIWYKGEIIGNEVAYNDHYRIRFEATSNRSDMSQSVRYIRPGTGSSNAQTTPLTSKCVSGDCRNGFGKAVLPDGTTYEGNFVNVKANGKGKVINPDGSVYEGDFVNGKFEGQGTFTITSEQVYTGQFANGLYNGKGKATFANGNKYDGDWVNGKKVGQGIFTFKNGEIYIGQFSNNVRNGKGKTTFPGGEIYDGNWVNDKRSGKGKTIFPNGDVYEGDYVDNRNEGQGTYTAKNGNYYIGEWKSGKQNGYGKEFLKATNATREGTWKDGVLINSTAATKITPTAPEIKFPIDGIATQLRETLNGKYDYLDKKPLTYILTNKKTKEVLRYQIEFIDDGGKLAFRWKESTKKEQSEKLVITDAALASATKYVNFFSSKTAIAPDKEIAFILSQKLHKDLKDRKEISLDLGSGVKRLTYFMQFTASSGTYTDKNVKVVHYHADDLTTKVQILDDPTCPLIVKIETAEYTVTLV